MSTSHLIEIEVIVEWDLNEMVKTILSKDGLDLSRELCALQARGRMEDRRDGEQPAS